MNFKMYILDMSSLIHIQQHIICLMVFFQRTKVLHFDEIHCQFFKSYGSCFWCPICEIFFFYFFFNQSCKYFFSLHFLLRSFEVFLLFCFGLQLLSSKYLSVMRGKGLGSFFGMCIFNRYSLIYVYSCYNNSFDY